VNPERVGAFIFDGFAGIATLPGGGRWALGVTDSKDNYSIMADRP
jgi:hypothetical protein